MELILWRHAEAENRMPDDARRLTDRGRKQAAKMASWLSVRLPAGYRVLASPARRAAETALALTENAIVTSEVSTMATPQSVLEVAGWPHSEGVVVVVGHQPTLGAAAALALTGAAKAWSMDTGAIWWLARESEDDIPVVRAMLRPDLL